MRKNPVRCSTEVHCCHTSPPGIQCYRTIKFKSQKNDGASAQYFGPEGFPVLEPGHSVNLKATHRIRTILVIVSLQAQSTTKVIQYFFESTYAGTGGSFGAQTSYLWHVDSQLITLLPESLYLFLNNSVFGDCARIGASVYRPARYDTLGTGATFRSPVCKKPKPLPKNQRDRKRPLDPNQQECRNFDCD